MLTRRQFLVASVHGVLGWTTGALLVDGFAGQARASSWLESVNGLGQRSAPRFWVVWIDVSASISVDDRTLYERAFGRLLALLRPGDRVVLARLGGVETLSRFRAAADVMLPDTGIVLNDRDGSVQRRKVLLQTFQQILNGERPSRTHILDALLVSEQLFAADRGRRRPVVLLLSDMLEDSARLRMEQVRLSDAETVAFIRTQQRLKVFPRLNGARVYVAGARAARAEKFVEVRQFWMAVLQQAGAVCENGMYVRDGLQIAEP